MLFGCQASFGLSGICVKSKLLAKHDFEIALLLLGAYAMDEILIVL